MSALLDIVSEARSLKDEAESEFRKAVVRAHETQWRNKRGRLQTHSLREIGKAAGLNFNTVRWIVRRENGEIDGYGKPREENER